MAASTARTTIGQIPLVTVEETPEGPEITTTVVASVEEASAVAAATAQEGALVAVDVDAPVEADGHASDDEHRDQQWALDQVDFESAWLTGGTKGEGVRVAVVDTGVQQNHVDFQPAQVLSGREFLGPNHQNKPGGTTDGSGHGTHVAGSIAARANNQTGITGAAPGVQILPVKVLCPDGGGSNSDVAAGLVWAVNNGAKVVNLSLGGPSDTVAMVNALVHARNNDVVVVASAGNCGQGGPECSNVVNLPNYPAAYDVVAHGVEAIAVAATINSAPPERACYSNSNDYVDITAPGGAACGQPGGTVLSTGNTGGYKFMAGTSMAAPHVSAAAALVRATHPLYTASDVRNCLLANATDLGSTGLDPDFGAGQVNPGAAAANCA